FPVGISDARRLAQQLDDDQLKILVVEDGALFLVSSVTAAEQLQEASQISPELVTELVGGQFAQQDGHQLAEFTKSLADRVEGQRRQVLAPEIPRDHLED